jgi:hypothetical protein
MTNTKYPRYVPLLGGATLSLQFALMFAAGWAACRLLAILAGAEWVKDWQTATAFVVVVSALCVGLTLNKPKMLFYSWLKHRLGIDETR